MRGRRVAFPFPGESAVWTHSKEGRAGGRDPRTVVAFGTREKGCCVQTSLQIGTENVESAVHFTPK